MKRKEKVKRPELVAVGWRWLARFLRFAYVTMFWRVFRVYINVILILCVKLRLDTTLSYIPMANGVSFFLFLSVASR